MPRIYDPHGTVQPAVLARCVKKIEQALLTLSAHPKNNGNPLLLSYAIGRRFVIDNTSKQMQTAATDGKKFYFHPDFVEECSPLQIVMLLKHECWHNLLMHANTMRVCEMPMAFNLAADFIVNALVELDWSKSTFSRGKSDKFWSEPFGEPITLDGLKELIKTQGSQMLEDYKEDIDDFLKRQNTCCDHHHDSKNKESKQTKQKENKKYTFVDASLLNRSAMDVYKEIKEWYKDLDERLQALIGSFLLDLHMDDERDKEDALKEVFKALNFAKQSRGDIPAEVEFLLNELTNPTLDLHDYIDHTVKKSKLSHGNIATYTRFKRRFIGNELFYPQYVKYTSKILVLLDTSGSMSDNDIAAGVSELKQFVGKSDIYIVPVDATPHWDSISKVSKTSDFKSMKLVGRGGTVFQEFFANYREKLKKYGNFSSIIVITDGYIDIIPSNLAPNCGVAWVMTAPSTFNQSFGQAIYLKRTN